LKRNKYIIDKTFFLSDLREIPLNRSVFAPLMILAYTIYHVNTILPERDIINVNSYTGRAAASWESPT
jgi:hypothetical protein